MATRTTTTKEATKPEPVRGAQIDVLPWKRIAIRLPQTLLEDLEARARQHGLTLAMQIGVILEEAVQPERARATKRSRGPSDG